MLIENAVCSCLNCEAYNCVLVKKVSEFWVGAEVC